MPPENWIGVASIFITVIGGGILTLIGSYLQQRANSDRLRLEFELKTLETKLSAAELRLKLAEDQHGKCNENVRALEIKIAHLESVKTSNGAQSFYLWSSLDTLTILDITDGCQHMLGWRPTELIGKSLDVLLPDDIRHRHTASIERAKQTGRIRSHESIVRARIKTKFDTEVNVGIALDYESENDRYRAQVILLGGLIIQ